MIASIFIITASAYFTAIGLFIIGWFRLKGFGNIDFEPIGVSVVIPCRNEANNLETLIPCLQNQEYPQNKYEIIIVDDHSTDQTAKTAMAHEKVASNLRLYSLKQGHGKKAAINFGVEKAKNQWIMATDADCWLPPNWISSMVSNHLKTNAEIIAGPVFIQPAKTVFEKLQALEFLSLIASTAGAMGIGSPIMANGANLAFKKTAYHKLKGDLQTKTLSGDDVFLVHEAKKQNLKIGYLKSPGFYVFTQAAKNMKEFFNQRKRWVSKSKYYKDTPTILVSLIVLITNFCLAAGSIGTMFNSKFIMPTLLLFIAKTLVDFPFLFLFSNYYRHSKLMWLFLPLQVVYPFYISAVSILGLLGSFRWKGRMG